MILLSDFATDNFDTTDDGTNPNSALPKLIDNNDTGTSLIDETFSDPFDFGVSLNSRDSNGQLSSSKPSAHQSLTSTAADVLLETPLDFMNRTSNGRATTTTNNNNNNNNNHNNHTGNSSSHYQQQEQAQRQQIRQQHRQISNSQRNQVFLDQQNINQLWSIYDQTNSNSATPSTSSNANTAPINLNPNDNQKNNLSLNLDSDFSFYPFDDNTTTAPTNPPAAPARNINKRSTSNSSTGNSHKLNGNTVQNLHNYAKYTRQQSVQPQLQEQVKPTQQHHQPHQQPQQKQIRQSISLNQQPKKDQYNDLIRSRPPTRLSHSSNTPLINTHKRQQSASVSPGLYAMGSSRATPQQSAMHGLYNNEFSPQQGPLSIGLQQPQQLQLINNQPLLSPPITRLQQAESPSAESYFAPIPPHEAELMLIRQKYKAKSSIPTDVSNAHYGQQCISAAISSRLNPFQLHIGEHKILRQYLTPVHVTTYLNIRNGILRLWLSNPKVNVTRPEAAGCAREERFFNMAEVAYDWLVRNGYINFGCFEYPTFDFYNAVPEEQRKPRQTVVIIGSGISGLSCARQLDNLFRRKARYFSEYQDTPRILLLEGRRRIGGRIYSAHLKSDPSHAVDVGAHIIPGYGNGNPLAVLIRRQLGLPVEKIYRDQEIHDFFSKDKVDPEAQARAKKLFDHLLERVSQFCHPVRPPKTAKGDEVLIRLAKDPREEYQESRTIAKTEDIGALRDSQIDESDYKSDAEWCNNNPGKIEVQFLKNIGIKLKPGVADDTVIHLAPEPQFGMYPSLGMSMDALLKQLQDISEITPQELRLLNWHYANLENNSATCLDNLSLGNWNQHAPKSFTGVSSMAKNGYMSLARGLYTYEDKLDVRFKSCVSVVEYSNDQAEIFLENGEQIKADRVIVTVPLGVLKDRTIQFIPDLPKWKSDSIERLGFGVMNKVCLVYEQSFWDEDKDVIAISQPSQGDGNLQDNYKCSRGKFYAFYNVTKAVGKPCLIGVISGAAALKIANESDESIVKAAQSSLEAVYPQVNNAVLVESIVTRWQVDKLSRGSYSYLGLEATGADYDLLARPIGESLFFAGEATSRSYPATVHGAYLSGLRAAGEVLHSLIGDIPIPRPMCPSKDYVHNINNIKYYNKASHSININGSDDVNDINNSGSNSVNNLQRIGHSSGLSSHVTPDASLVGTPTQRTVLDTPQQQPLQISSIIPTLSMDRYQQQAPPPQQTYVVAPTVPAASDENSPEAKLKRLKEARQVQDNERMRIDMIKELGERPMKPERSGANPFLIFQKDFWEKCRQECDAKKQAETKDPSTKAARNEVRAALGKMWRELPDKEKEPYLEKTKNIKETNNKKSEQYREKMRRYDTEAEDFRRRWKEEKGSKPSEEENKLQKLIQNQKLLLQHQQQQREQQQHQKQSYQHEPSPPFKRRKY